MDEDMKQLLARIELTDDMLEDLSGGFELSDFHKGAVRYFSEMMKMENKTLEQFIEHLRTESMYSMNPDRLEAAIAYAHEIWQQFGALIR